MIKLYGIPLSNNVNKVRYILNYLGLEYENIPTNPIEGENQTEEYKALCPSGKIPAIDIDGFKLFESNAINKYLVKTHNADLYPTDPKEQAVVDAWMDFTSIHIMQAMGRVVFNRAFAPMMGKEKDENSLQAGLEFLGRFLPAVDKQLGSNEYLAGSKLTLADINLLAALDMAEMAEVSLEPYANITKWRQGMQAQDFYQKCYKNYTEFVQQALANA